MEWKRDEHGGYPDRNKYIYEQRKMGRTLKSIADEIGVTPQRIRDLCKREERRERHRTRLMQTDCSWR